MVAAKILSAKFLASELWVERVSTSGVVLYRNQWPVDFILHFGELHSKSSIRYKLTLFENYIPKCYIVKRISISFNCFSEYTYILTLAYDWTVILAIRCTYYRQKTIGNNWTKYEAPVSKYERGIRVTSSKIDYKYSWPWPFDPRP